MSAEPHAILADLHGTPVPLQGVTAHGALNGLVYELTVEQRYHNHSEHNLEAVFTFPLPLRAVLLGFELEIGERKLSAVAVERREASRRYEKAIDEGNAAALIEQNRDGLYTVSLGNLKAGESAVIRYRYAELLDAHDGHVRLNVPTVIAPRYGDPASAGLSGPSIPGVDLLAEYPFAITIDLGGLTDTAAVRSPTHPITTAAGEGGLKVSLTRNGYLDRDFVLEIDAAAVPRQSLVAADGDEFVLLTSATLQLDADERRPLALKILLDCSGSMNGDSITAARSALLAILDRLTPADRVSLTRFGSSVHHVTDGMEPADEFSLHPLKALVRTMNADLGGTEMRSALQATLAIPTPPEVTRDLILITDGEIYDIEGVVNAAACSGHRLFAIAIGAAPVEALARSVAEKTGGACEFVAPGEDAEGAILRTFNRLRSRPRTLVDLEWPATPAWVAPLPSAVFPGDTIHLMAGFAQRPQSETRLTVGVHGIDGTQIHVPTSTTVLDGDLIPRIAASRRLSALPATEARQLAVRHQLATRYTSFVVVAERAEGEQAEALPATVAVRHMLAAGWGGSAAASCKPGLYDLCASAPMSAESRSVSHEALADLDELDIPSFLRRDLDASCGDAAARWADTDERTVVLLGIEEFQRRNGRLPASLVELESCGPIPEDVLSVLRTSVSLGRGEGDVVAVFVALLAQATSTPELSGAAVDRMKGNVLSDRRYRSLRAVIQRCLT